MHSQLHERLEYLVNFSSQLIFVSGDSVAQQQKTLEAFVFRQHDETEIAYLTAQPGMTTSDYRRQLCQQLLGQQVGSYVRPLTELLADLNNQSGPVLITLTQAEHLPDELLQELWDLVLQNRMADNHQHLNVLLFGQTRWAENAKQWLPAKNSDTPLLISSQSVMAEQVGSDLDRLISQRRDAFHAHLAARTMTDSESAYDAKNWLASGWFWATIAIIFMLSFSALVSWQYGSEISALFSPIDEPAEPGPQRTAPAPGSAYQQLTQPAREIPQVSPATTISQPDTSAASATPDARVTSWKEAIGSMHQKAAPAPTTGDEPRAINDDQDNETRDTPDVAYPEINYRQAVSLMAQVRQTPPASSGQAVTQPAIDNTKVPDPDNTASNPELAADDNAIDNQELLTLLRADDYVIQLAGLKDYPLLSQFVTEHQLDDKIWIYQTRRYGGDWFVLLFKQPFASISDARNAIALLPDYPRKDQAFVKTGQQVISELNQTP
ncbi:SPOR domain-containing protein [Salinimonas lutimaris]|uniref:SPOR domain-containing protein n=1 Tax=Salinimonas lutimaris TaxID=914153 RepID=UPI0010C07570|nr:AAA family ATPase [Salinimonas lutimaris]